MFSREKLAAHPCSYFPRPETKLRVGQKGRRDWGGDGENTLSVRERSGRLGLN